MKIWHISDTHTYHKLLEIPEDIDIVIFSGDCSNPKDLYKNEFEVKDFLDWFGNLPIKYKIMIAGNHDISIEKKLITQWNFDSKKIIYLENSMTEIEGLKIWGSPFTPTFGTWSFMKARHKLNKLWEHIPDNTDILITHGPPKGILDLTENRAYELERVGCSSLFKRVLKLNLKLMCFGHIHNTKNIINAGTLQLSKLNTVFSNGSVVTDGKFGKLSSNGNIIDILTDVIKPLCECGGNERVALDCTMKPCKHPKYYQYMKS